MCCTHTHTHTPLRSLTLYCTLFFLTETLCNKQKQIFTPTQFSLIHTPTFSLSLPLCTYLTKFFDSVTK